MPGMDPHSAFIVSNIDVLSSSRIGHLQPQKAYQVWLEGFLRNGKVVKSNVLSITTKTASSNLPVVDSENAPKQDYYNSMLIASIIAGVAILGLLIVSGFYLKRTTTYKAIISGDGKRKKASFNNRAFKASTTSIQMSPRKPTTEMNGRELNRNGDSKS